MFGWKSVLRQQNFANLLLVSFVFVEALYHCIFVSVFAKQFWAALCQNQQKWHVCPSVTKISLGIGPVLSESWLSAWRNIGPLATHWAHKLIWADAQADLSLCWEHSHFVGFVMRQLIVSLLMSRLNKTESCIFISCLISLLPMDLLFRTCSR